MKNGLIILVFSLCAIGAMAQTEKGKFRLGGDINLGFLNTDYSSDYKTNGFNIYANGGYFIMDNLSLDLGLGYNWAKIDGFDGSSSLRGEIGARYYLPINVFLGASFDAATYNNGDNLGTGVNLKAGYAWFIRDNIALEPAIGYRLGLSNKNDGTKYNEFGAKLGLSVYF